MKIALFHELPKGGARRAMNSFASQLKKHHVVDLYIVDEEDRREQKFYTNVFLYRFLPKKWLGKNWKIRLYKDTLELFQVCTLNKKIARAIDKKDYDVVLVSASKFIEAPFIMRFLKTPFVFFPQDPFYRIIYDPVVGIPEGLDFFRYRYEKINRFVRKILDRQNVTYAKLCLSPSKFIGNLFSKTYNKPAQVIYDGVDEAFFRPSQKKKDIDVLYIGSYEPVDGYKLLTQTLFYMKKKIHLREVVKEKEWITDDKILRDLYQRAKIVFCPARNEGLGLVLLESLSCGTPVVALDQAGHKEIIHEKRNGYLVKPDPKGIAKLFDRLLSDSKEVYKLGRNGRKDVEQYWSWQKQAKKLEKVLFLHSKSKS